MHGPLNVKFLFTIFRKMPVQYILTLWTINSNKMTLHLLDTG